MSGIFYLIRLGLVLFKHQTPLHAEPQYIRHLQESHPFKTCSFICVIIKNLIERQKSSHLRQRKGIRHIHDKHSLLWGKARFKRRILHAPNAIQTINN